MKLEPIYRLVLKPPTKQSATLDELFLDQYHALDWSWVDQTDTVQVFGSREALQALKFDAERGFPRHEARA